MEFDLKHITIVDENDKIISRHQYNQITLEERNALICKKFKNLYLAYKDKKLLIGELANEFDIEKDYVEKILKQKNII